MRKVWAFLAGVIACIGLFAMPAAATFIQGSVQLPNCAQVTHWEINYGGGYGTAKDIDYPSCYSQVIVYYRAVGGGAVQSTATSYSSGWQSQAIPPGGGYNLLYADFNFYNPSTGQIWGYRRTTGFCC